MLIGLWNVPLGTEAAKLSITFETSESSTDDSGLATTPGVGVERFVSVVRLTDDGVGRKLDESEVVVLNTSGVVESRRQTTPPPSLPPTTTATTTTPPIDDADAAAAAPWLDEPVTLADQVRAHQIWLLTIN